MMHPTQRTTPARRGSFLAVLFWIVGVAAIVPSLENIAHAQRARPQKTFYEVPRFSTGAGTKEQPYLGWDRQMNRASAAGREGLTFYFPAGWYQASERVTLRRGWQLYGDGLDNTVIVDPKGQGVFYAAGPVNGSTGGYIRVFNLRISNGNLSRSATGAAIEIFALTHVELERVSMDGWKVGCILDQAELTYLRGCHFELTGAGGVPRMRGLWIVNGPDRNHEAKGGFSNVIHVRECNFNGSAADQTFVVDDGGTQHTFTANHHNGGGTGMVLAGVSVGTIQGCYFESQDQCSILFDWRSFDKGTKGVGQSGAVSVIANSFSEPAPAVRVISAGHLTFTGNGFLGTGGPAQIVGCGNAASLVSINDSSTPPIPIKDVPEVVRPEATTPVR